jgi:hypothetical protein
MRSAEQTGRRRPPLWQLARSLRSAFLTEVGEDLRDYLGNLDADDDPGRTITLPMDLVQQVRRYPTQAWSG